MDIKEQVEKVFAQVTSDEGLKEKFMSNPLEAVKGILGSTVPDDILEKITDGVKTLMGGADVSNLLGKVGDLFGK